MFDGEVRGGFFTMRRGVVIAIGNVKGNGRQELAMGSVVEAFLVG
jgi:hypothetical protein